jgi:hypothetical protein
MKNSIILKRYCLRGGATLRHASRSTSPEFSCCVSWLIAITTMKFRPKALPVAKKFAQARVKIQKFIKIPAI